MTGPIINHYESFKQYEETICRRLYNLSAFSIHYYTMKVIFAIHNQSLPVLDSIDKGLKPI